MTEYSLVIEGLTKSIGGLPVLAGLSCRMKRGAVTAIIGPNGAGKTTLLNIIGGEVRADSGSVTFEGQDIRSKRPWEVAREGIGRVFQDVRVFGGLTPIENVVAALQLSAQPCLSTSLLAVDSEMQAHRSAAYDLLAKVAIDGSLEKPASELSWGNQKLLAFARLLAGHHRLVLLDEPVAGVAPALRRKIKALIEEMVGVCGTTVVIVEHDLSFVAEIADYVAVIEHGVVEKHGAVAEILKIKRQ